MPPATWIARAFSRNVVNDNGPSYWPNMVFITGLAASMAVNALVTGMIVFRILKVTARGVKPSTSVERTLGSTGGNNFQHIMFIIIESGIALFAIQLVRFVLEFISVPVEVVYYDFVAAINQMLNVIILRSSFLLLLFC